MADFGKKYFWNIESLLKDSCWGSLEVSRDPSYTIKQFSEGRRFIV